jgi:hypothetical protein
MVTMLLDSTQLEIVLSGAERAMAFHRGNVVIDRSHIAKVQLTHDAWTWLRGVRSPGTHIPAVIAMGTFRLVGDGTADFVIIRRGRPSVVIDLEGDEHFQRVILSTRHGLELVQALQADVAAEPADVVEIAAETGTIPTVAPKKRAPKASPAPKPAPAT